MSIAKDMIFEEMERDRKELEEQVRLELREEMGREPTTREVRDRVEDRENFSDYSD